MNMKKLVLAVAMASGMAMSGANAATDQGHGKITFKGAIIDAACSIDASSLDQTHDLGAISMKKLDGGGKSTPINFNIQLHDCDTATAKNATVKFNGVAGDASEGLDGALAVTGQGSGVGVVITNMGGKPIKPNMASPDVALNDGDNNLEFQAYVQGASASGAVVPGAFTSVANFVMQYK
ncbi:type 1 fimbrial protein [Enterobacter asburiae]|uniref:fimbrial protein n=1 Tax=Enterobacter asburiae TaxID=61645 RepID=UPI00192A9B20|nr:fimbrial protein [Enterobacter asburiae]MBL5841189.1 type 1 fimbrial protein [Enterobacter asburiae]MBL5912397.1 type 1 fimbrial protein [Enterobacter asburiae]MBL5916906.1 type 1 fimbrial protein [Enterobacter asburiae]MBL5941557.1 type 1 fimbrial protein [Enterobacter asburiae]MBL5972025.1 type 1 fimbrial protein [Enterobacter asburiae]